jgi:hypothetical protein
MLRLLLVAFFAIAISGTASAQSASGRWSGNWISDKNGHTGTLHARLRQIDDDTYRAAFHGRFAKVIPFWYSTKMHVEGAGDGAVVLGVSQRLPLVGEYRTTAVVTATDFNAIYTSKSDSGRFVMKRR